MNMSKIVSFVSVVLLFATAAYAADFSAEMVSLTPQGNMTAKMYVSGQKSRLEMPGSITISRIDKKMMWMLMPTQKAYFEQPIEANMTINTQEKLDGEVERTAIGKETVNGMNTTKYRVTYETAGRRDTVFQWIDDVNRFPVKTAAVDGS